jgi:hypothetical protein
MNKNEALNMAINKWQNNFADERHNNQAETMYWINQYKMAFNELLNACKEALEQPAQEPVAWMVSYEHTSSLAFQREALKDAKEIKPLYTHPYQDGTSPSKWTALTDDEIDKFAEMYKDIYIMKQKWQLDTRFFARAIEQALKEKNT